MSKFKLTSSHECLIVSHVSGASSPGVGSVARWNVIKAGLRWPYMTWWAAEKGFKSQGCVPALYQPDLRDWISASPARGLCGFIAVLAVLWLCSSSMRLSSERIHISTEFNKLIQFKVSQLCTIWPGSRNGKEAVSDRRVWDAHLAKYHFLGQVSAINLHVQSKRTLKINEIGKEIWELFPR